MERMQQIRDEFGNSVLSLESEFLIKKDDFVTYMITRLGPLQAMELLLKAPEFAKSGISHEAYKVYVFL